MQHYRIFYHLLIFFWNFSTYGFTLNLARKNNGFTNILVLAFRSLGDLTGALQTELVDTDTGKEREEILNIIRDLDRTGPFTGMGYFDITNGTLTAMTSVGFTYLIILVQFRQS